jgi:hypothetical protein
MNPVGWWICHEANGVHLQTLAIHILSSGSISRKELEHILFIICSATVAEN